MKTVLNLFVFVIFNLYSYGQKDKVTIEGQILGYRGNRPIGYSINDFYQIDDFKRVKPDSLGRFVIEAEIQGLSFFSMIYIQDNKYHSCKLIIEPGSHYSFISEGRERKKIKLSTPDIYTLYKRENYSYFKRDLGQMYFNLIDNNTMGYLYLEDWDLMHPDSLIPTLTKRINTQLTGFNNLLASGEINKEFFEIARLNVEYTQAYRLAVTINSTWNVEKFKISDSTVNRKLRKIYQNIFEMYPVNKNVNLQYYNGFDKYVDLYLIYISQCKTGEFIPDQTKDAEDLEPLIHSEKYLNERAFSTYSFITAINNMASNGINASEYGREVIMKHPNINKEIQTTYSSLLRKADEFGHFSETNLPADIIISDGKDPINSFKQLQTLIKNQPALIIIWGTWCLPCISQFQFLEKVNSFLEVNRILAVYIAFEYVNSREKWGNLIKRYKLEGFNFIANKEFTEDFEKHSGKISEFPTFMIIDRNGILIETMAFPLSEPDQLINQLKQKLNLN